MPPKTKQQNTQPNGTPPDASARKQPGSQRAQIRAAMTTEYQERFLSPRCHTAVVSTSTQKDPYHSLKATSADMTTFRSYYVTHKWVKNPPKPPQPSLAPKGPQRCTSAPVPGFKVEDYTSVYKNDYRVWKQTRTQPFKLNDSLKVNEGLVVGKTKEGSSQKNSLPPNNAKSVPHVRESQPFESMTSYRTDYITHQVPPRTRKEKPEYKSHKATPFDPAVSLKPKVTWDANQELFDKELFQQFKTWSLANKLQVQVNGKAKAKESRAENDNFLSTTHADFTPHKCQRTKPVLPGMQNIEKSKDPFTTTTTMREDYKAWDIPKRTAIIRKEEMDWPKKTFSVSTPVPADGCKTKLRPTAACCDNQRPQCSPDHGSFSGFECISNGKEESGGYWTTTIEPGMNWPCGEDGCDGPSETHHIIRCLVASGK